MMATSFVKPFLLPSFAALQQNCLSSGALKQASTTAPHCVLRSRRRSAVLAKAKLSTGLPANNAFGKSGGRWEFLPLVAGPLGANLLMVNNAGALDESDAVSAYNAFIKGSTSVADTVTSDGGDAIADLTAVLGDNAPVIGAVVLFAIAVPVLISTLFRKGYAGNVSATQALGFLEEDTDSILIDIRTSKEISEEGSPKLAGGKKAVRIQFEKEADGEIITDPAFVSRVEAKSRAKDATIYVIDKTGSVSIEAAKSLTQAGFTKAFVISGGTDAWLASELPWLKPTSFGLDLSTLRQAIDATVKENPNVVPTTLGIAAATAGSLFLFSEAEVALQLLGSAAVAQLVIRKLLFAEDRKRTIEQVKSFLDTKVAPQELVDDIKEIGTAVLPIEAAPGGTAGARELGPSGAAAEAQESGNALSSTEAAPEGTSATSEPEPSDGAAEAPVAVEATKSTGLPPSPTPLSPYTQYPDLKPPASPTPAKP